VTSGPSQSAVFYLTRAESSQCQGSRRLAQQQKREVYRALSEQNLDAIGVLALLSKSASPFARLFSLAVDELSCTAPPLRCHQVEDLERDSAVQAAKLEVEIQQLAQRLERTRADRARFRDVLDGHEKRLRQMNMDVERISYLMAANGIAADQKPPPVEVELDDGIVLPPMIPLDEAKYRGLWAENMKLQEEVEELRNQLSDVQARQMGAMKERARDLLAGRNRVLM
jgi:hypothetical protein